MNTKSSCKQALFFDRDTETVMGRPVSFRRRTVSERAIYESACARPAISPFAYVGRIDGSELALWTEDGRWREDGTPHPQDLAIALSR